MSDKPYYYTRYTIQSLCPAPSGTRLAYAQEDEVGGIWYEPCYFMAVCDCQEWVVRPPFEPHRRAEKHGEPTREIVPVCYVDRHLEVCDVANLLALLMPGMEVDETDASVIAARQAAIDFAASRSK